MLSVQDVFLEGPREAGEEKGRSVRMLKKIHSLAQVGNCYLFFSAPAFEKEQTWFQMHSPTTLSLTPSKRVDDSVYVLVIEPGTDLHICRLV